MKFNNRFVITLLGFCILSACKKPNTLLLSGGLHFELAELRKASISNVSYKLEFKVPEPKNEPIKGNIQIGLDYQTPDQPLILDFKNPGENIIHVKINEELIDYQFTNGHIIIPPSALNAEEVLINIEFIAGNQALNRNEDFLYALFVPDKASTAFPCFDQPNIKARYEVILEIPNKWDAFTNNSLTRKEIKQNRATHYFSPTLPISTYLFSFGVGDFQSITRVVNNRSMTLYHRETDQNKIEKNIDACFELHGKALSWLEDYTGIPYPFDKFDFALIPAFQFGGMEHPGAIWYRSNSLFLDDNATVNQKMSRNSLIAHETAHMWFGDLVTMDWFDDVWLKEVFANFMAAKMVNPNFPEINHDLRFLLRHHPSAYGEDRTKGSHGIQQKLDNLNEASLLYGRIIYQKAPVVMKQLESIIGVEKFQSGLQEYLNTYSFGNAKWDDLIDILDKRTSLDLKEWNQAWVKESGMPHLKAKLTLADDKISKYSLVVENRTSGGTIWHQNSTVSLLYPDSVLTKDIAINSQQTILQEITGLEIPLCIIPGTSEKSYGYFQLDEVSQNYLLDHVFEIEDDLIKSSAWFSLWESFLRKTISPERMMNTVIKALPRETDVQGLSSRLGYLRTIYWGFIGDTERLAKYRPVGSEIWNLMETSDDPGQKKLFYDTFVRIAESDEDINKLLALWKKDLTIKDLTLSESNMTTLAYALAVRGVDNTEIILSEQLSNISNPDRKAEMEFVIPALSQDQNVRDLFFEKLKDKTNRQKESWVLTALQYLHHPIRAEQSEQYLSASLDLVKEIQETGSIFFPQRWIGTILGGHKSASAYESFETFISALSDKYPDKLKNKILMAGDMLERKQGNSLLN